MLTLLVAEDEFVVLEVLTMALEGEGYRVLKASNGIEALRTLSEHRCDVVICDEHMPGMTGQRLIEVIRSEPRNAGVGMILMAETWGRTLPTLEGVSVLGKPIMLGELFRHIRDLAKGVV